MEQGSGDPPGEDGWVLRGPRPASNLSRGCWVEVGCLACPDGQDGEAKTEYMEIKTSTCETRHQEPLKQNETKHCSISRDMFAIPIVIDRRSTTWSARAKRNTIEIKIRLSPGGLTEIKKAYTKSIVQPQSDLKLNVGKIR